MTWGITLCRSWTKVYFRHLKFGQLCWPSFDIWEDFAELAEFFRKGQTPCLSHFSEGTHHSFFLYRSLLPGLSSLSNEFFALLAYGICAARLFGDFLFEAFSIVVIFTTFSLNSIQPILFTKSNNFCMGEVVDSLFFGPPLGSLELLFLFSKNGLSLLFLKFCHLAVGLLAFTVALFLVASLSLHFEFHVNLPLSQSMLYICCLFFCSLSLLSGPFFHHRPYSFNFFLAFFRNFGGFFGLKLSLMLQLSLLCLCSLSFLFKCCTLQV
mmetsp:Transcript_14506/g.26012  ORF Transcript_14506/g.26012 Transcript_14506/m.26012 type:complete len:267 (+) Transcript_14506:523-1323(+)